MSDPEVSGSVDDADSDRAIPDDLVARVATYDEELAEAVGALGERTRSLADELADAEAEVEDLKRRLKRARADFENYKKRVERREEELRERATEKLVERLLAVRDDLRRAVEAEDQAAGDLRDGIELTLRELDRILDAEGVESIEPAPGDEPDPHRHEVVMRVEDERPAETIAEVFEPGYEQGGKVLQPAKVTVSDGPAEADEA